MMMFIYEIVYTIQWRVHVPPTLMHPCIVSSPSQIQRLSWQHTTHIIVKEPPSVCRYMYMYLLLHQRQHCKG